MNKFIIQDWASNTLQYDGSFNFGSGGSEIGAPMDFETFDDAWEYIFEHYNEEDFDDLCVMENKENKS